MARSSGNFEQMKREAQRLHEAGDDAGALGMCERLLKRERNQPHLLHAAGVSCRRLGRLEDARRYLARAIEAGITNIGAYQELARVYETERRFADAQGVLDKALRLEPGSGLVLAMKAEMLRRAGDADAAIALLEPLIGGDDPHPAAVGVFGSLAPRDGREDEAFGLLDRAITGDGLTDDLRSELHFQRGALHDRAGRYEAAWGDFETGNVLVHEHFDAAAHERLIDWTISFWTREHIDSLPRPATDGSKLVFIVGMPRSGSSLIEQIIASHPRCHGGGELQEVPRLLREIRPLREDYESGTREVRFDRRRVDRLSATLLRRYARLGSNADRMTDKALSNYRHLGLLSVLAPGARVIHCVRDPLDCCLSSYFIRFAERVAFAYDLGHLGHAYRNHLRLMDHWKRTVPLPILDVRYEDVVAHTEREARRMIGFLGLEWDERCLRFYEQDRVTLTASTEQVRRPVYASSVGRARAYDAHLGALKAALEGAA